MATLGEKIKELKEASDKVSQVANSAIEINFATPFVWAGPLQSAMENLQRILDEAIGPRVTKS